MTAEYMTDEEYRRSFRKKRRRKKHGGRTAVIIILLAALVFVAWRYMASRTGLIASDLPMENIERDFSADWTALEARVSGDMYKGELNDDDASRLRQIARQYPEYADAIGFIASHFEIYGEDARNNVVMAPEKAAFVALEPFTEKAKTPSGAALRVSRGTIPYLLQYDSRWAYHKYGSGAMGYTACGPTSLSMAALCLTGDSKYTPDYIADWAENNGYYVSGAGTAWSLFTDGASRLGLRGEEISVSRSSITDAASEGRVVIASMLPGDFTMFGHILVIADAGALGVRVYDPSSVERSAKLWSWDDILPQFACLWAISA